MTTTTTAPSAADTLAAEALRRISALEGLLAPKIHPVRKDTADGTPGEITRYTASQSDVLAGIADVYGVSRAQLEAAIGALGGVASVAAKHSAQVVADAINAAHDRGEVPALEDIQARTVLPVPDIRVTAVVTGRRDFPNPKDRDQRVSQFGHVAVTFRQSSPVHPDVVADIAASVRTAARL